MQLKMFEKAIDPLWIQQDPENKGYITKDQSGEMVKLALEKVSMSQYYNQTVFDKLFDQYDVEKTEKI